ncbi:MAG: putative Ig domain-containing protein [Steroidobacteraceae bacterium]
MAHTFDRIRRHSLLAVLILAAVVAAPAQAGMSFTGISSGTPKISGTPPTSAVAGSNYVFQPTASDPNGDPLVFSINKRPNWARFDTATGRLYGVPTAADAGRTRDIVISVSDGKNVARLPRFTLRVSAGTAPTISGSPPTTVSVGTSYDFKPSAADPDGQALTFAVINKPTWASFDTATGRLTGKPGAVSAGTYSNVGISVTDGASTASLAPFTITVTAQANTPPTISGTPSTSVQAGNAYDFRPTATDADGNALRFSIVNPPSWATFDAASGRLSGTPQSGNVGTYAQIVLSVSDGTDVAFLPMFSITVTSPPAPAPANRAPTISGTPSTSAKAGQPYAFAPTASDPDGQALTFSISGKPSWASFDTKTGALTGTPGDTSVGTYGPITISVSDGAATATLPSFSVVVAAATTGWATLSWVPPTQHVDGTPLTDLAGYRVMYGQSATTLDNTLQVAGASITTATIQGLKAGTWYFAVKAYTADGSESDLSTPVYKVIQ